jgi:hypothetical protein
VRFATVGAVTRVKGGTSLQREGRAAHGAAGVAEGAAEGAPFHGVRPERGANALGPPAAAANIRVLRSDYLVRLKPDTTYELATYELAEILVPTSIARCSIVRR